MKVSGIIVTRGDVDVADCLDTWPSDWERVVWNNGRGDVTIWRVDSLTPPVVQHQVSDLSVYGRYAAIEYTSHDLVFVQDDDVIVSDPQRVADCWIVESLLPLRMDEAEDSPNKRVDHVVCNMTEYHQLHHSEAPLLGFGSVFHRDAPGRAFARWDDTSSDLFRRTCDVVFAALTPNIIVDVPFEYLPQASSPDRMSRQAGFAVERQKILDLALAIR